ncbi:MAG: hypothetical protein ACI837_001537 [Crocinitomicaceae bacterium]|jgi:hypothetical protein
MKNLIVDESISNNYNTVTIKDDIIYVHIEPVDPTQKVIERAIGEVHQLCENGQGLILVDPTDAKVLNRRHRMSMVNSFNQFATAVAFLNTGIVASLMIHFMIKIDKPRFSIRAFASEMEAIKWLNTFRKE